MDEIRPQPGPQQQFLTCQADIAIYGGAAGGGKSWALLLEPLYWKDNPDFRAVVFRRTYSDIMNAGGLWDESAKIYPLLGARPNQSEHYWKFPSGARVEFAHLQHDNTVYDWQGAQVPLFEFDELTHFSEAQFFYMLSRARSLCGVRPYLRGSCNPDADSWVERLLAWWIDQDTGLAIPERAGVMSWFVRVGDKLEWADSRDELVARDPDCLPKSLTFVPARLQDNQILMEKDPDYLANLLAMPLVEQQRLLAGNWKIRPAAGKVFNRGWFELVDALPTGGRECRFWDFANTKKTVAKPDPDFTAAVKMRRVGDAFFVVDCLTFREGPAEVETIFKAVTTHDAAMAKELGLRFSVRWESEPGSASGREDLRFVRMLAGIDAVAVKSHKDKISRAAPLAAQSLARNVKLLRADWNEEWLTHMHHQPDGRHDDIMDASAGAFNELATVPVAPIIRTRLDLPQKGTAPSHPSPVAPGLGDAPGQDIPFGHGRNRDGRNPFGGGGFGGGRGTVPH